MPPWIWPSTWVGLIARPTSCAATIASTLTVPSCDVDFDLAPSARRRHRWRRACPGRRHRAAWSADRSVPVAVSTMPSASAGEVGELDDRASAVAVADDERRARRATARASARHWRAPGSCARRSSPASRAALPETNVWREAEVLPASAVQIRVADDEVKCRGRQRPARRRRSASAWCSSPGRCRPRRCRASARRRAASPIAHRRGIGHARCCRCRTTCRRCRRRGACAVGRAALNAPRRAQCAASQSGLSASRHCGRPRRTSSTWPVAVASPRPSAFRRRISSGRCRAVREIVHQRLVGDRRLRHAEAAEGAGRRGVGVDRAGARQDVRHAVGSARVDRHAVGDGRPPGGVGAGVEVAVEVEGEQAARRRRPTTRACDRGGWRLVVEAMIRRACRRRRTGRLSEPRGDGDERLHRHVELAAEAAAAGGGQDAHASAATPSTRAISSRSM